MLIKVQGVRKSTSSILSLPAKSLDDAYEKKTLYESWGYKCKITCDGKELTDRKVNDFDVD